MAAPRRVIGLVSDAAQRQQLQEIARSRSEPASRVERARIILGYLAQPSAYAVARAVGVTAQTVSRCVDRAAELGVIEALDDRQRTGRDPTITAEARTWLVALACQKPKALGIRTSCGRRGCWPRMPVIGSPPPATPVWPNSPKGRCARSSPITRSSRTRACPRESGGCAITWRSAEFEPKMAEILCIYRQVAVLREQGQGAAGTQGSQAIISYDEKPGIQAIGTTAPDRPPLPGTSPTVMRDHEYKRHGTLTLIAGIDLLTGHVHALVRERHRSREFIEFLKLLNAAYPADTAIELILDNHSAHVSRETTNWLAAQPIGRFTFTFTPTHGSWLNLIDGFFSKLARSVLRHIRVRSKHELNERLTAFIADINSEPVVHTWRYKIDDAA
jgi:transposase